jgi:arsenate reductase
MGKKILVICTGNSCRSQMAEGFLRSFDNTLEVHSAGTHPADKVNPNAVKVMKEIGINISHHKPELVDNYIDREWDYVITVCGGAKEVCPAFTGMVKQRLHIGFDDPADSVGSEEEVLAVYQRVRDEIKQEFGKFYHLIARG